MLWLSLLIVLIWALAYFRISMSVSAASVGAALLLISLSVGLNVPVILAWIAFIVIVLPLTVSSLRQRIISGPLLGFMRGALPPISQTEREALEAGSVWWDAQLFSGKPDWNQLLATPKPRFSEQEQAFLDGPVQTLCSMLDEWEITYERRDLPKEVWDFIKKEKFFGMIIPQSYGGLGFSALAHSEVVMKVASRSLSASVTVMVPNSLGPAQLLLEYGTEEQKEHYLPRLAVGEEIPCFALTGPEAGSDAGAIPDTGIVCKGEYDGKKDVLGLRLNWEKRYITLAPVATVLGLAFKLYDPDHLLSEKEDVGVTLALIPTTTAGVSIGNRHFPLDSAFQNGPTRGKDVFIPIDMIIGGAAQAGNGWRMLMECLAEGRSISLPALSTGSGKIMSRITGAYARVRHQFKMPIGRFEGIEEPLARIASNAYIMDAARRLTAMAVDSGEKPSVISAIVKYQLTERMRKTVNDAMDIQGGSGICLGPSNFIGRLYQALPIGITVEGANILTRSMIIFGQGAIRCHPYLLKEVNAAQMEDAQEALVQFDDAVFKHIGYLLSNLARTFWLGLSHAMFVKVPGDKQTRQYYRQLTRLSAIFALSSDVGLLTLGGKLKRKERLSGYFADVLSNLYLCSAVLKHYEDQGRNRADLPLLHYSCRVTIYRAQQALFAVFWNLPLRPLAYLLRALAFPTGKAFRPPADDLIHTTAELLLEPSDARDRLTQGIYTTEKPDDVTGRIEYAFGCVTAISGAERKLKQALKDGQIKANGAVPDREAALAAGVITAQESEDLKQARIATLEAIRVDEFTPDELNPRNH